MRLAVMGVALVAAAAAGACAKEVTGPDDVVSVAFDSLPFPSVVTGDTLRDSSGAVAPVRARGFNFRGEPLDATFRYLILDRGARVDSVTGVVVGDSARETPVRVVAAFGSLQTPVAQLSVVRRPDSLHAAKETDTLRYSLVDTTANTSADLTVRVLHKGPPVSGVPSWIVSYRITYPSDTSRAGLVADGGTRSRVDTTGSDGSAARRVRISAAAVTAPADSVVVLAAARYRGSHVAGSPRRIVVHLRPRTQ